jgi:hypothetical protein
MRRCSHCENSTLGYLSIARSNPRRPVVCTQCGEYSYLPSWASLASNVFVELCFWLCVGVALWQGAGVLVMSALLAMSFAVFALLFVAPLRKLLLVPGHLRFTHPSKFYSRNP